MENPYQDPIEPVSLYRDTKLLNYYMRLHQPRSCYAFNVDTK